MWGMMSSSTLGLSQRTYLFTLSLREVQVTFGGSRNEVECRKSIEKSTFMKE